MKLSKNLIPFYDRKENVSAQPAEVSASSDDALPVFSAAILEK
jgi:hypothetical protein